MSDIDLFDYFESNAAGVAAITTTTPLHGTGSLSLSRTPAGSGNVQQNLMPKVGGKFTSGRARFLVGWSITGSGEYAGFLFQSSQRDLTGSVGTAYQVRMVLGSGTAALQLHRLSAGMPTSTTLVTASNFAWNTEVAPQAVPVEVVWQLDIANLNGIRIVVKRGAVASYVGQTDAQIFASTVLTVTDIDLLSTTTVLQTSQGEGPTARVNNGTFYLDKMSVVPYIIGGA